VLLGRRLGRLAGCLGRLAPDQVLVGERDDVGRPSRVVPDTIVNVGIIYKQLVRTYDQGGVLAGYIAQGDTTAWGTKPWLVRELDPETQARVEQVWDEVTA
jgi:hypothetical protein